MELLSIIALLINYLDRNPIPSISIIAMVLAIYALYAVTVAIKEKSK